MENRPSIAIVILNWNGIALFPQFLPSLVEHSHGKEISLIVADNGSTDGSPGFLEKHFPEVKVISLGENYGFAGGYNRALSQVNADIFVLVNSDIEVTPGWLEPCISRLMANPGMAAVQPKVRSWKERHKFEYAGAAGGFLDHWGYPFCRGRLLSEVEEDHGQYDQPLSIFWATGACMFLRAEAFRQSGGFDEDFFAHMEEIDLCWRLKNQGWTIGFEPTSLVYHLGGATLSYQSPQKVFLNFRNSLWMLLKNLPPGRLIPVLLPRMILDGAAAAQFLATRQSQAFKAVWKAHKAFYGSLRRFLRKRKALLPQVKNPHHPEVYHGSMVWNFYVRRIRRFSQFPFHPGHDH